MRHRAAALCALLLFSPVLASGQDAPKKTPEQIRASYEAHKGDFDYLLGDWRFSAKSKQFGAFTGLWSAVRLAEGQILDEYRIVDDGGGTVYVTSTIRNYNAIADRWELIGMESSNGLQDFGTARKEGAEMRIEQRFGVAGGQPAIMRIRYRNITADRFSWTADRSTDGGKTWDTEFQTIEAVRIGKARTMEPLTKPKR